MARAKSKRPKSPKSTTGQTPPPQTSEAAMDDITLTDDQELVVLALEGEMAIERAEQLKTSLIDALASAHRVAIDLEQVTKVGLSCLQLLCSAHQTALSQDKILTFQGQVPEVFRSTVDEAGYSRRIGCTHDQQNNCLWINGETQ